MASKSRGAIEEGSIIFSNETEKTINFTATTKNQAFSSPPSVKIITVQNGVSSKLLLADNLMQKDLMYTRAGSYIPTFPVNGTTANAVPTAADPVSGIYEATLNNNDNLISHSKRLNGTANTTITVPFNNSSIVAGSLVQIFFQAKFDNWDVVASENFKLHFVNKTAVNAGSDSTPYSNAQTQALKYHLYMNDATTTSFKSVSSSSSSSAADILASDMNSVNTAFSSAGKYIWFRLDLNSGVESITDLSAIAFENSATDSNEYMYIANMMVFIWQEGASDWVAYDQFDKSGNSNPNVGINFLNVTTTSMKVQTSAPFSGVIRYLCSVQG